MNGLLLVGSPRLDRSASERIGAYLLQRLAERGVETDKQYIYRVVRSEERLNDLVESVAGTDLVIFSSPLYVDALPAAVTQLLEVLHRRLDKHHRAEGQRLVAISNCGFPEAEQNEIALRIYRAFARQSGFTWAGGLALGGGEMIKQRPLEPSGPSRPVVEALDATAGALVDGDPVPQEAADKMAGPLIPVWIYRAMGNMGWHYQALRNGTWRQLRERVW